MPLARNKKISVLNVLKGVTLNTRMASMEAVRVYDRFIFTGKPMLADVKTAIIGPFGFCTGKPMQVEEMTAILAELGFFNDKPSPV